MVTGIQFWVTDYLVTFLGADPNAVVVGFALASLTGPTAGVFFGGTLRSHALAAAGVPPAHLCVWPCLAGWVVDKRGGYKDETGHSTVIALECCVLFGVCALVCSILTVLFRDFLAVIAALWLVLFFGGYGLCAVRGCRLHHLTPATPVWTQPQMPAPSRDGDHHRGCAAPPSIVQFCMGHDAVQLSRLRRCALHLRPACAGTAGAPVCVPTRTHRVCVQWTSLAWGFRFVMAASGLAMVFMVIGWRTAAREYEQRSAHTEAVVPAGQVGASDATSPAPTLPQSRPRPAFREKRASSTISDVPYVRRCWRMRDVVVASAYPYTCVPQL